MMGPWKKHSRSWGDEMMKEFWIRADLDEERENRKRIATHAIEKGFLNIVLREEDRKELERLGRISPIMIEENRISSGGREGVYIRINDGDDEKKTRELAGKVDFVVISTKDWKVIPTENLIAAFQGSKTALLAEVRNAEEARLFLETMESGVDGILLSTEDMDDISDIDFLRNDLTSERVELVKAKIIRTTNLGSGDRVCIDTCSMLQDGEGMLIGSSSSGLFLVHSETVGSEYADPRPFRVNAGPVHSYVRIPGNRTRYLSELKAGDMVLAVDPEGSTRSVIVGRSKIETRPMMMIECQYGEATYNIILQNAETIRLVSGGRAVSVVDLNEGDEILMEIDTGGRHFGISIDETVWEK